MIKNAVLVSVSLATLIACDSDGEKISNDPISSSETIEDMLVGTWICQSQYASLSDGIYTPTRSNPLQGDLSDQMAWVGFEFPVQGSPIISTSDRQLLVLNQDHTAEWNSLWVYDSQPPTLPYTELDAEASSSDWPFPGKWSDESEVGTWSIQGFQFQLMPGVSELSSAESIQFLSGVMASDSTDESVSAMYLYSSATRRFECLQQ